jgi:hypothetical protein
MLRAGELKELEFSFEKRSLLPYLSVLRVFFLIEGEVKAHCLNFSVASNVYSSEKALKTG